MEIANSYKKFRLGLVLLLLVLILTGINEFVKYKERGEIENKAAGVLNSEQYMDRYSEIESLAQDYNKNSSLLSKIGLSVSEADKGGGKRLADFERRVEKCLGTRQECRMGEFCDRALGEVLRHSGRNNNFAFQWMDAYFRLGCRDYASW